MSLESRFTRRCIVISSSCCYRRRRGCFLPHHCVLPSMTQSRRYHGTPNAPQYSEDRVASWCRRLWALAQCGSSSNCNSGDVQQCASSVSGGRNRMLLGEVQNQAKLAEELKAVMIGEKGRLPESLVESVWHVYESIIPPDVLSDMGRRVTPVQEAGFFDFVACLTELDINLADVRAAAKKLGCCLDAVETLLVDAQRGSGKTTEERNPPGVSSSTDDAAALSTKLVVAKNALLRQCFAVRQAGSPVHYLWLRQTASLERGMRRLMDLRRCVTYFNGRCRERIASLQVELKLVQQQQQQQKQQHMDVQLPTAEEKSRRQECIELWVTRQRHVSLIDGALEFLFSDFFAREWLVMEELTWYSTPPSLLEQVIAAEQVHPFVGGLADIKQRLQPTQDRHLFAFFHPAVVEEPLIAVQVALTHGIAGSVDHILGRPSHLHKEHQQHDAEPVDTAIFYSINSAQSALRGINLGNMLIKRVVREIEAKLNAARRAEGLSPITTFSTLSPIPGYIPWFATEVAKLQHRVLTHNSSSSSSSSHMVTTPAGQKFTDHRIFGNAGEDERRYFAQLGAAVVAYSKRHGDTHTNLATQLHRYFTAISANVAESAASDAAKLSILQYLLALFQSPNNGQQSPWWEDGEFTRAIERPLLRSVAHYLCREKRRNRILDPVGNFHISNGATMLRLNYLANCTATGSRESATVMVNYLYDPAQVSAQVNAYEVHRTVPIAGEILQLLGSEGE